MAGELCSSRCGWCGRCDPEPDDLVCDHCGRPECLGECQERRGPNQDGTDEEAA